MRKILTGIKESRPNDKIKRPLLILLVAVIVTALAIPSAIADDTNVTIPKAPGELAVETHSDTNNAESKSSTEISALSSPIPSNPQYQVIAIPALSGDNSTKAYGINASGTVAGRSYGSGIKSAIVWNSISGTQALSTISGDCSAWGINDVGQVSGYSEDASGNRRAVRWDTLSTIVTLGNLTNSSTGESGPTSDSYDLNNAGDVVGNADIPNDANDFTPYHAFLYKDATGMEDLETFCTIYPQWQNGYSIAYDINNNGVVAGSAHDSVWTLLPFTYDETSGMQQLSIDPTYSSNEWYAVAINDADLIGGHVIAATNQHLPCYWTNFTAIQPTYITMPAGFPYGETYGINSSGLMVGLSWDTNLANATDHAFLFDSNTGIAVDLNSCIDPASGWVLEFARDINDAGQIVGTGTFNGDTRGFLLDPITVNISVTLQGGSRIDPSGWEVPLAVQFFEPGSDPFTEPATYEFDLTTSKSGSTAICSAIGVAAGTYDITAKSEHTLMNIRRNVSISSPSTSVDMGTLLEGNANDNDIINISDFGILALTFSKFVGDAGFDTRADFDRNGTVNISDFGLLAINFMKTSPVEIP